MPEETSGDTSLSLFPQQSVLVSSFQQHWQRCVCVCSFVFVCVSECSSGSDPSTGESSVEKHHTDWISRQSEMNTDHFLDVVTADCSSWRTRQRFASSVSTQNPSQEQDSAVWLFDYVRQATPNLFIVQTSLTNQMSIFFVWFSLIGLLLINIWLIPSLCYVYSISPSSPNSSEWCWEDRGSWTIGLVRSSPTLTKYCHGDAKGNTASGRG